MTCLASSWYNLGSSPGNQKHHWKIKHFGSSQVVQWLELVVSLPRAQVQSLVGELRFRKLGSMAKKKKKKKVIRYMSKTILLDFPIPTSESLFLQDKNGENLHLNFISSAHMLTESSWFSNFLASCKPSPFHLNLLLSPVSTSCLIILYLPAPSCSFTLDGSS